MPEVAKSAAPPQQELETSKSPNFVKVYANSAQIEVTPWDFKMIFGELQKAGTVMQVENSVAVIMSPQHAKALLGVLATNVQEYEKHVGEIKLAQQSSTEQPKPPVAIGTKTQ